MVRYRLWKICARSWCMHQTGFGSAARVSQSKSTELCSSAAVVPQSKSTEKWSSAGPFDHDVWYFRHQTNEHFNSILFIRKNQPTVAPLSSHWNQHARPNYWRSYWRKPHTHIPLKALTGLVRSLNSDVKAFKTVNLMYSFCQQVDDWMLLRKT